MPFRLAGNHDPAITVGDLLERRWGLAIGCSAHPGEPTKWQRDKLAELPAGLALVDLCERLKCSLCGGSEGVAYPCADPSSPGSLPRMFPG